MQLSRWFCVADTAVRNADKFIMQNLLRLTAAFTALAGNA